MTITSYSSGIVLDTTDAEFSAVCDNADTASAVSETRWFFRNF